MTNQDREFSQLLRVLFTLRPDMDCFCGSLEQLREAVAEAKDEERGR